VLRRRDLVSGALAAALGHEAVASPLEPYALFERFPRLDGRVPRVPLGAFPTPVEEATDLGRALGCGLWIKRDDVSGEAYGGGKVRKLELFLGDALRRAEARGSGERLVVTFGGVGSNQAVATAIYGAKLGLSVRLWLAPQPASDLVTENLARLAESSADVRRCDGVADAESKALREAARDPTQYVIPAGGTSPLGTLSFVSAGLELAADFRAGRVPLPARIYAALGSGGSVVGLSLGLAIANVDTTIVAVRASSPETSSVSRLRAHAERTIAFARSLDASFPDVERPLANVAIEGRFLGAGYGAPTREGERARALAREVGLVLEPVYTAKTLAALAADAKSGARGPALFIDSQSSRR
jgi:D-cysteine desulfhydrase